MWGTIALCYHLASRLGYVFWVGGALRQQERTQRFTRAAGGVEAGWLRFRRIASTLMNNDGVSFVVLVLLTRNTLVTGFSSTALLAGGVLLALAGVGIKVWAAASLGPKAYYWHNFFDPDDPIAPASPGPYRYFRNPMYTLGYLQTYGLALMFGSFPALIASAFDQAAVLTFHVLVERPHYRALLQRAAPPPAGNGSR